MDTELR